jgi:hypothetical protein
LLADNFRVDPTLPPYARRDCGDHHTDPVFDVGKSTSFHQLSCSECKFTSKCESNRCAVSLAYAEGSRWDAYEVRGWGALRRAWRGTRDCHS